MGRYPVDGPSPWQKGRHYGCSLLASHVQAYVCHHLSQEWNWRVQPAMLAGPHDLTDDAEVCAELGGQ